MGGSQDAIPSRGPIHGPPHFLISDALTHDTERWPIPERKTPLPSLMDPER